MRVATFSVGGERRLGMVDAPGRSVAPFDIPSDEARRGVTALFNYNGSPPPTLSPIEIGRISLEAPIPRPERNIFCVGKNYHEHAHEFSRSGFDSGAAAGAVPKYPIIFSKVPDAVIAPTAEVVIDREVSTAIDYEAELAVIIGKPGRHIAPEDAWDHVWGYTIVNDVTARDLQTRHSQWLVAKSQDTFCPMGPWAVTRDEIDIADTAIRCFVNGDIRQSSNTRLLIFDIPTILATISAGVSLRAGDIVATGTPAGVGIGFDPPRYLKAGDVVRIEIDGIGVLENRVREATA
jgi:2-keto-4-pentenoate hydratase/2-oxohepta-3-ene-1,7-dioic acid hydratase in catechol pathway